MKTENRIVWLDWMRVCACLMVMIVHSTEPFYLGGEGALILTPTDAFWTSFSDSFVRACVPLFVITSSYLLFPLQTSTGEFFRRRMGRLLLPFIIWSLIYAFVWGEPIENLHGLLLNFNYAAGHLWFVYMILGVYLLMPLLSPWAERVGRRELLVYLGIWAFTLTIPFIREAMRNELLVTHGPTGIPNPAPFPLWGEASWNAYGTFYYASGFIGYLLLGIYFRKFVPALTWTRTLAIGLPAWFVGFGITFAGFLARTKATAAGSFPVEGPVDLAVGWETPWLYDTLGVALMALGWVLFFRKITASNAFYSKVVVPVSKASYGMYLCHILILITASGIIREWLGIAAEGRLGFWTTPVEILLTAFSTFIIAAVSCVLIQRIPKVGKWIVG